MENHLRVVKDVGEQMKKIIVVSLASVLFAGIFVCFVCDYAVNQSLGWSWITASSAALFFMLILPVIISGKKGIFAVLLCLSIGLFPYLYLLDHLIENSGLLFAIGVRMSVYSIIYLWCVYALCACLRRRKWLAAALAVLLAVPLIICINVTLSDQLSVPAFDIWDAVTVLALAILAAVFWCIDDRFKNRVNSNSEKE